MPATQGQLLEAQVWPTLARGLECMLAALKRKAVKVLYFLPDLIIRPDLVRDVKTL